MYLLRLALNVTPSLPTSPADSLSFRQAAPHSARLVFIIQDFLKLCKIGFNIKETLNLVQGDNYYKTLTPTLSLILRARE